MYGTSNGLGVGTTGNTFRLVPKSMQYTGNHQLHRRINALTQSPDHSKPDTIPDKPSLTLEIDSTKDRKEELESPIVEPENTVKFSQPTPVEQLLNPVPRQSWSQVFQQVCTKQLFECFRQLKQIIMPHGVFQDTILAYIDYQNMRALIEDAKQSNSKDGVMSLKVAFTTNPYNLPSESIETGNYLVSILELLGPQNHVVIALHPRQVQFLQGLCEKSETRLYWPNGNEGISWFTTLS
jgi:hypothetical protein